jgi:hypothetical protein
MAFPELQMVGSAFCRNGGGVRSGSADSGISREVKDMIQRLMYPKPGWIILHVVAIFLMFLLGYLAKF